MKRARAAADKALRRQAFLEAASRLFGDADYAGVTMEGVAREAGLSKGTVYLYFGSKEALFLELLIRELEDWFGELLPALVALQGQPAEVLARGFAASLVQRPRLTRLLVLLHVVLEHNVKLETARSFKLRLLDVMTPVATTLEEVRGLAPGQGMRLLLHAHALMVGLLQLTRPSAAVATVLEDPRLAPLRLDFQTELERAMTAVLRGQAAG